ETPTASRVPVETAEPNEPVEAPAAAPAARVDPSTRLLEEASGLATEGAIVAAHRKLAEIPPDSSVRQSEVFKSIERRWADEIFKAAEESPDPGERRSLLDKVAKTLEVDAERRQRAVTELAKLDEGVEAVDVADLPSAESKNHPKAAVKPPAPSVAVAANKPASKPQLAVVNPPRRAHAPTPSRGHGPDDASDAPRSPDAPDAPAPAPAPAPRPAAKQQPAPETGLPASELTREPPF